MVHVFTTNKNGKIELTKDEIKKLLDEAYWDGYRANSGTYTYATPSWRTPYTWTVSGTTISSNTSSNPETINTGLSSETVDTVTLTHN